MGKLKGIIPIEGTVGNITFAKTQDGIIVKEKSSIPASRIANDPAFQRTRENNAEFRNAVTAGKLMRLAFQSAIINAKDRSHSGRLMKRLMKVLKSDTTHVRGERLVSAGELSVLEKFEFNKNGSLASSMFITPVLTVNRATGTVKAEFGDFKPASVIDAPAGTTHVKLILAAALVNFNDLSYETHTDASAELAWNDLNAGSFDLSLAITPASTDPMFIAVGIEYYQSVNSVYYALKNGASNAMGIVKVVV